jgi:hypothetical protein
MNNFSRFQAPIQSVRPRGERLIEAFSIKLGRRVQCFGELAYQLWILLETNPAIDSLCERPALIDVGVGKRLADFWHSKNSHEEFLLINRSTHESIECRSPSEIPIRIITLSDLAASRTWISNWQRLLPLLVTCREHISPSLVRSILKFIKEPTQLSRIEREFVTGDATILRAALCHLLHQGMLKAPSLHVEPISYLTYFEPKGD